MTAQRVRIRVPASTANLGPGFDTLGMALNLYAWIELGWAEQTTIRLHGSELRGIPTDKSNLVYQVAVMVFEAVGETRRELHIEMGSDIPLTRGLGSSASAIVGALCAANELTGGKLGDDELFQMATKLEDHPDNVGAALFGGLVVASWDGERADYIRIEPDARLEVLVVIPSFELSTEKARHALPAQVSMKDAVYNVSHSSLLVAALCTGRLEMIQAAMKDALHQPYRSAMVPGMDTVLRDAWQYGALGAALSGAGPTLLALVDGGACDKRRLETFMEETMRRHGVSIATMWLKPCSGGAHHWSAAVEGELRA